MRLVAIGVAAGFLGALFGVGGGIVIVPALVTLCAYDAREATATSMTAVLITAVAGAFTYALHGEVKPGAAALLGLPAVVGVVAGTTLQQRIPVRQLTYGFALLVAVVAVRIAFA